MEATSRCLYVRRTVFNGWELLRKYECEDCGAIATCLCDKSIAQYVLPHQAMTTQDPESNQRVPVTEPLVQNLCHACRGERSPAFPRAARSGHLVDVLLRSCLWSGLPRCAATFWKRRSPGCCGGAATAC